MIREEKLLKDIIEYLNETRDEKLTLMEEEYGDTYRIEFNNWVYKRTGLVKNKELIYGDVLNSILNNGVDNKLELNL